MKLYLILSALLLTLTFQSSPAQQKQPNIIIFIADDLGWNDLGCYGNKAVSTPHIDRMAREGITFTNAYLTTSSCSPSRTSIISGRYPHNTGSAELHTPLPAQVAVFPELLKNAGYYTAQAGKWHMGDDAKRGFDLVQEGRNENGDGGEDMWVTTLQQRPKDKPFFMWFASFDAHRAWGTNEFSGTNDPEKVEVPPYLADTESTKQDLAKYYDEISRLDDYIGRVQEELKKQGVLDNTMMIIMSDNGRPFPRSKTRVYDSGVKTPFIVKWNEGLPKKGVASESLVSVIDIAPTLLDLAGAEILPGFQGKSFAKVLKDPTRDFRNYVFAEHNWHDYEAHERMVRTKNFLYVLNARPQFSNQGPADSNRSPSFEDLKSLRDAGKLSVAQADNFVTPRPAEELFDCRKDPMQLANVASLQEYQKTLKDMRRILTEWRTETFDTTPEDLTADWYDRETGEALDVERTRGEMPGGRKAQETTAKGPF